MSENNEHKVLTGKAAGLVVKGMIESVEKRMAAGEKISAAPTSASEAKALQEAREKNQKSKTQAQDSMKG